MALFKKKQTTKKPVKKNTTRPSRKVNTVAKNKTNIQSTKPNNRPISASKNNLTVKRSAPIKTVTTKNPRVAAASTKPMPKNQPKKKVNDSKAINKKIKTQSPSRRTVSNNSKKVKGGVKNFEIKSRPKQVNHKFYIKKKKTRDKGMFRKRVATFLLTFVIVFGIFAVCFSLSLTSTAKSESYWLQIGETVYSSAYTTDNLTYEVPSEVANLYGVRYIPMYAIAEYCEFSVSGTQDQLKYSSRVVQGQSVRFNVNSNIAFVNNQEVVLKNPPVIYNGRLYVPLDFFEDYSEGLTFEYSEDEGVFMVYKSVVGFNSVNMDDIYSELTFKVADVEVCTSVTQPDKQNGEENYEDYANYDEDDYEEDDDYYDYDDYYDEDYD